MASGGSARSNRGRGNDPLGALLDNLKQNPIPGLFTSSATDNCVVLCDWWLTRSNGEGESTRVAVSGYTSKKLGEIPFTSAPVVKRQDSWTIEAADGVIVKVEGLINQEKTQNNGFSHELCQQFNVGFPLFWKQYVNYSLDSAPTSAAIVTGIGDKTLDFCGNGDKEPEHQHEDEPISTGCKETEEYATLEKDAEEFPTAEKDDTSSDKKFSTAGRRKIAVAKSKAEEFATPGKDAEGFPTAEKDDTTSDKKFSTAGRRKIAVAKSKAEEFATPTPEKDAEELPTAERDEISSDKKFSTAGRRKIAVSKSKVSDMSPASGKGSSKKDHAPQSRDKTSGRGPRHANFQERGAAISPPSSESNIRRTRSGRAIIPAIDKGSQRVVYDEDGNFAGVASTTSLSKGSTSKPSRKKKRF